TRPTGSQERRSSAFVRKDSLTDDSDLRSGLHDDLALDGLDSRRGLGRVQDCLQCRQRREVTVEMHGAVAHRYSKRAGMKIRRLRDRLLNAAFDIVGGWF